MAIVVGPILGFRGTSKQRWTVGALVVVEGDSPPPLSWPEGPSPTPVRLAAHKGRTAWRFDLEAAQRDGDRTLRYAVDGEEFTFAVPAAGSMPRIAYCSCNGFSSLRAMKSVEDKNALWKRMAARHGDSPYHLLLMGGDQVYADEMWETVEPLKKWNELPLAKGNQAAFGPSLQARVRDFYFNLYCRRWAQPEMRAMLAAIPTVMMWDDHDIFDGWGSYPAERHASPVFQGIFALAREHFRIFQQQWDGGPDPGAFAPAFGFSKGFRIGDLGLLVLDMRSERTEDQVLSREHWDAVFAWLGAQEGLRHLLLMASIPVVHPGFDLIERTLGMLPGNQSLEDDLKDHWRSRRHKGERLRLIHRLLSFAIERKTRVTLVSGDVHLAALGILQSDRSDGGNAAVINQLTASGIVHPPPPAIVVFAMEQLMAGVEEVDRGITAEMAKFPGLERRFVGARNWLSLAPDQPPHGAKGRLWADWIVEGERDPFTKVIHPVS